MKFIFTVLASIKRSSPCSSTEMREKLNEKKSLQVESRIKKNQTEPNRVRLKVESAASNKFIIPRKQNIGEKERERERE